MRILIIEDDLDTASYIKRGVEEAGHIADHAAEGKEGLLLATTEQYDVLIIDRMLPEIDGLTIIKTIRASENNTPVLILSALGEVDDRVRGLKAGASRIFRRVVPRLTASTHRKNSRPTQDLETCRE